MPRGGSETILLVDDEDRVRALGSRILTKAGYTVISGSNGREGLQLYEEHSDDIGLVILDLIMPVMDGKKCLAELLKKNPALKVLVASGHSANGRGSEALAAGARGFIDKPYDMRQLREVVRAVLDAD